MIATLTVDNHVPSRTIAYMPPVNGPTWRKCRVDKDLTSDQAAELLGITGAALRQIELEKKPASDRLIARAARLYRIRETKLQKDGPPKQEPVQPEPKIEPVAPPGRQGREGKRTGPRRATSGEEAVA